MPSIGTYSFITLGGQPSGLRADVQPFEFVNVIGTGYKLGATHAPAIQCRPIVDVASEADAETLYANLQALIGTLVTVVDDHAITWTNCMIEDVQLAGIKVGAVATGGVNAGTVLVSFMVALRVAEAAPA